MPRDSVIGSRPPTTQRGGFQPTGLATEGEAVQVQTDMASLAQGMVEDAARAVSQTMLTDMLLYRLQVQHDWPVKTGKSLRGFSVELQTQGTLFTVRLRNPVEYSGLIKQPGYDPANPAVRIVFDHTDELIERMIADIVTYLQAT